MKHVILLSGNRPHAGKDTFVDEFLRVMSLSESSHLKLSLPLKRLSESAFAPLVQYLNDNTNAPKTSGENWYENKNEITRLILQAMGGTILDEVNEDYLINVIKNTITEAEDGSVFIISDWRKIIEYYIINGLGDDIKVTAIRINRPLIGNDTQNSAASIERELDEFNHFHYMIDNDGSIDDYLIDIRGTINYINDSINKTGK